MAADVNIKIGADNTEFIKKAKETQTLGYQLAKSMSTAIGVGVANLAGNAMSTLTGLVRDSVAAYQASYAANQKLESVIRATGGAAGITSTEIRNLASSLQGLTNFEDDATINASAVLLTFKNIGREVMLQTIPLMQDLSAVFGQDLQSSAVQLGKALDDPIKGITALRKVGVSFTDEQQNMIRAMVEGGNVAEAQGEILKVLAGQVGGAAQSMADGATQVSNAWGDFLETIGESSVNAINRNKSVIMETISAVRSFWLIVTNPSTWDDFARGGFLPAASMAELEYQTAQVTKTTKEVNYELAEKARLLQEEEQRQAAVFASYERGAKDREALARSIRDQERQDASEKKKADEKNQKSVDAYLTGERMRLQETVEVNDQIVNDDIRAMQERQRMFDSLADYQRSVLSDMYFSNASFGEAMTNVWRRIQFDIIASLAEITLAYIVSEEAMTAAAQKNVFARIALATFEAMKTVAMDLWGIISGIFKFFASLGPFGLALAAGVSAGAVATVKGMIQATKFAEGGLVDRPTLGLIGEAGPELIAPRDNFIDALNRVIIPSVVAPSFDYDKLARSMARVRPRVIIGSNEFAQVMYEAEQLRSTF